LADDIPSTHSGPSPAPAAEQAPQVLPAAAQHIPYATPEKKLPNGPAIASLVVGTISVFTAVFYLVGTLPGVLGVVLGTLGLRKARDPAVSGRGRAIAGITLSGAGIFLSLFTAVVLHPVFGHSRRGDNRIKCASNMRQLGLAMVMYAKGNGGRFPDDLGQFIAEADVTPYVATCPSVKRGNAGYEGLAGDALAAWVNQNTVYIFVGQGLDVSGSAETVVLYEPVKDHAGDGANVLFLDAHTEFLQLRDFQKLLAAQNRPTTAPASQSGMGVSPM
jgi:prepilin-type processing-associated H-X9-DG protein